MIRRGLAAVVATAVLLLVAVTTAPSVSAHTELLRGSPGPAQRAGGTVDFIDLVFLESVTRFDLTVEGPSGESIAGTLSGTEGQLFRYSFEPLTETGRYIVSYSMISADGDDTETAFFFTYEPDAPQPLPLGEIDVPSSGNTVVAIVAGVIFALCLIGLALVFLLRLERKRASGAAAVEDPQEENGELTEGSPSGR